MSPTCRLHDLSQALHSRTVRWCDWQDCWSRLPRYHQEIRVQETTSNPRKLTDHKSARFDRWQTRPRQSVQAKEDVRQNGWQDRRPTRPSNIQDWRGQKPALHQRQRPGQGRHYHKSSRHIPFWQGIKEHVTDSLPHIRLTSGQRILTPDDNVLRRERSRRNRNPRQRIHFGRRRGRRGHHSQRRHSWRLILLFA